MVKKMSEMWKATTVDMKVLDWQGNPIQLTGVPAIQDPKTGNVRVYPSDVAMAENAAVAKQFGMEARDISLLLTLYAKPGIFKEGEVYYRYHINKMLFYQQKELKKAGLDNIIVHDKFVAADRGPMPENIVPDLDRLSQKGLLTVETKVWGKGPRDGSKIIKLTEAGKVVAEKLWWQSPEEVKKVAIKVKEQIYPATPKQVRERVHREYPELRTSYKEEDTD